MPALLEGIFASRKAALRAAKEESKKASKKAGASEKKPAGGSAPQTRTQAKSSTSKPEHGKTSAKSGGGREASHRTSAKAAAPQQKKPPTSSGGQASHNTLRQSTRVSTPETSKPSTNKGGSSISRESARLLARAGVPFIEVTEAGYTPLLSKAQKAQRYGMQAAAQAVSRRTKKEAGRLAEKAPGLVERYARSTAAAAGESIARVHHEAQRVAMATVTVREAEKTGKYEAARPAKKFLEKKKAETGYEQKIKKKYRELVEKIGENYKKALTKIEEEYSEKRREAESLLHQVEETYKKYKAQGVKTVLVDTDGDEKPDKEMSLEEWYTQAKKKLQDYLAYLENWRRQEKKRLEEEKEEELRKAKKWLEYSKTTGFAEAFTAGAHFSVAKIEHVFAKKIVPKVVRALKKTVKEAEKNFREWLNMVEAAASKTIGERNIEKLADKAYEEARKYWLSLGFTEEEAEKKAREARERVLAHKKEAVEKARKRFEEWLEKQLKQTRLVTRKDQAKEYAEKVREAAYRTAVNLGFSEREARRLAEEAYRRALRAGEEAAEAYGELLSFAEKRYGEYVEAAKKNPRLVLRDVEGFRRELLEKARSLGIPDSVAMKLAESYASALRSYASRVLAEQEKARKHRELLEKAAREINERLDTVLRRLGEAAIRAALQGRQPRLQTLAHLENEVERVIEEVAKKYKLAPRDVEELKKRALEAAEKTLKENYERARRLAEAKKRLERQVAERVAGNPAYYLLNPGEAERLAEELLGRLPPDQRRELAELKSYLAQLARAKAAEWLKNVHKKAWKQGFILLPVCYGNTCKLIDVRSGRVVATHTVRNTDKLEEELAITAAELGYASAKPVIVKSSEEAEKIIMAVKREKSPKEYMARLMKKAFSIETRNPLKEARELATAVTEFYRIPAEKLYEKGRREGGAKGAAEAAAGLAAAFGTGAISTMTSAWDIPGMAAFARELASGRLLREAATSPTLAAELAGGIVAGAVLPSVAKSVTRAAGTVHPALGGALEAATKAGELAAATAFAYGLYQGLSEKHGSGALPLAVAPLAELARRGKARAKLELETAREIRVPRPSGEAVEIPAEPRLVLELFKTGLAKEPVVEIAGKKYELVKLVDKYGERYELLRKELVDLARIGQAEELAEALNAAAIRIREENVLGRPILRIEVLAEKPRTETKPSIEQLYAKAKQELLAELKREEAAEKLRKSMERMKAEYREYYPETRVTLGEAFKWLEGKREQPRARYESVYETEKGPVTLGEVLETLTRPEREAAEEARTMRAPLLPGSRVKLGELIEAGYRRARTLKTSWLRVEPAPAEMVAVAEMPAPKPPRAAGEFTYKPQQPKTETRGFVAPAALPPEKPPHAATTNIPPPGTTHPTSIIRPKTGKIEPATALPAEPKPRPPRPVGGTPPTPSGPEPRTGESTFPIVVLQKKPSGVTITKTGLPSAAPPAITPPQPEAAKIKPQTTLPGELRITEPTPIATTTTTPSTTSPGVNTEITEPGIGTETSVPEGTKTITETPLATPEPTQQTPSVPIEGPETVTPSENIPGQQKPEDTETIPPVVSPETKPPDVTPVTITTTTPKTETVPAQEPETPGGGGGGQPPRIPPFMLLVLPLGLALRSRPAVELASKLVEEEYVFA